MYPCCVLYTPIFLLIGTGMQKLGDGIQKLGEGIQKLGLECRSWGGNAEVGIGIQKLGIRILPGTTSSSFCLPIILLTSFSSQIYSTSHFGLPPHRCHRSSHLRHRSCDNSVSVYSACSAFIQKVAVLVEVD